MILEHIIRLRTALAVLLFVTLSFLLTLTVAAQQARHFNGNVLLGSSAVRDGDHEIHTFRNARITATVHGGKVTGMRAVHQTQGLLKSRKVRTDKRLALRVPIAYDGVQLVQNGFQYGWCFDDGTGLGEYCYWYDAGMVVVDETWQPY